MDPEKDECDTSGHAVEVVDAFGADASCHCDSGRETWLVSRRERP